MKRTFRTALPLAASLASAALLLTACGEGAKGSAGSVGSGPVKVGLITKTDTNPFFVKMKEGAEASAKKSGAELSTAAGKFDGDNEGQVTAIENMVAAGVKGILITPNDSKAIVPAIQQARKKGVLVIALDSPTDPQDAADALFATDNLKAGELIGRYAKAAMAGRPAKIATLDLAPGVAVGQLRHDGFLKGYGIKDGDPAVACSQDTGGDQAKGQTAMENCLQKAPDINLVYTINEPAALGAYTALKAKGREKDVLIVSVDGGCTGTEAVKSGKIAATSQQYPLLMAAKGVEAVVAYAEDGTKASGYVDTGVNLITDKAASGVSAKDTAYGLENCWG
ncbi:MULTISPECIES: sugar ABC transporter substrate-binding protein [Streptomyces]|uniref:sugar ABC transporter substrate-binding protein n=1 Tax=Streptomyces TaxID=1883 RepID=UPI001316EDE4|nr:MULTISPECIES: sugar ABC transporter substrate-binding protein [Streptomyces]QGZ51595.1 substrate-binding domain-containing protein [Streptomyces sp. QHH-9511]GGT98675.1 sugar ABC transporter substrate-binding protein [Streptomyces lateritius]